MDSPISIPPHKAETHSDPSRRPTPAVNAPSWAGHCLPCRQKNAASFLKGETPGTQKTALPEISLQHTCELDEETVRHLVIWREEAPYG